jgi:preprotein translocase subunit SecG
MYHFILLIHVFVAVMVVALVLIQQGKGATMGAAFGSGASQTVFGSRGSGSFLFRITISLAIIFFMTSIGLNYLAAQVYKQEKEGLLPNISLSPTPTKTVPVNGIGQTLPVLPEEIPERK